MNVLQPGIKKGDWTAEEDQIISEAVSIYGKKWSQIAQMLPGRSDNAIKNRWNAVISTRIGRNRPGKPGSGSITGDSRIRRDEHDYLRPVPIWVPIRPESPAILDEDASPLPFIGRSRGIKRPNLADLASDVLEDESLSSGDMAQFAHDLEG
jgi:hypothetical protein